MAVHMAAVIVAIGAFIIPRTCGFISGFLPEEEESYFFSILDLFYSKREIMTVIGPRL